MNTEKMRNIKLGLDDAQFEKLEKEKERYRKEKKKTLVSWESFILGSVLNDNS